MYCTNALSGPVESQPAKVGAKVVRIESGCDSHQLQRGSESLLKILYL